MHHHPVIDDRWGRYLNKAALTLDPVGGEFGADSCLLGTRYVLFRPMTAVDSSQSRTWPRRFLNEHLRATAQDKLASIRWAC